MNKIDNLRLKLYESKLHNKHCVFSDYEIQTLEQELIIDKNQIEYSNTLDLLYLLLNVDNNLGEDTKNTIYQNLSL
jgi:hypothetical protein